MHGDAQTVDAEYVPKMNVTPNAVALEGLIRTASVSCGGMAGNADTRDWAEVDFYAILGSRSAPATTRSAGRSAPREATAPGLGGLAA